MQTPKEYIKNLKAKKITKQMLADCIFSANKRAKNYRNLARDSWYHEDKLAEKRDSFYRKKETLLAILEPVCIHKESYPVKTRVYSRDFPYYSHYLYQKRKHQVVWQNSFYDYHNDEEVEFFDYISGTQDYYYLYYQVGDKDFHSPIKIEDLEELSKKLQVVTLEDNIVTDGKDVSELISNQFVDKVVALVNSKDFELVE